MAAVEESLQAPVKQCPTCGARGTLAHRGEHGDIHQVECDPMRHDRTNPDAVGCGDTFEVDVSTPSEEERLRAEVEELRESLEALQAETEGTGE